MYALLQALGLLAAGTAVMEARTSHTNLKPEGGWPVVPSAVVAKAKTVLIRGSVQAFVETSVPRALRLDELPGIIDDYRQPAHAAVDESGFDAKRSSSRPSATQRR